MGGGGKGRRKIKMWEEIRILLLPSPPTFFCLVPIFAWPLKML